MTDFPEKKGPGVLVCGGRNWRDYGAVLRILTQLQPGVVIAGDATGADALALEAAAQIGCNSVKHHADWERYGKAAGPIRNGEMLRINKPDVVVAFPGGRGTADMVRRAKAAGIRVIEPCFSDKPGQNHE